MPRPILCSFRASARPVVHLLQLLGPFLPASFAAFPSNFAHPQVCAMTTNQRTEDEGGSSSHAASGWRKFLVEDRDWRAISEFWAESLVKDSALLPVSDAGSDVSHWVARPSATEWYAAPGFSQSHWRKERSTFLAEIAYVGEHFSGLQRHPGQRTIIGCLEETLGPLVASQTEKKERIPGLAVSGRTDASVSAYGQVLSMHTWRDVDASEIAHAINSAAPAEIKALRVHPVPRAFHANFAATWRRYLYLFPLRRSWDQADGFQVDNANGDSGCEVGSPGSRPDSVYGGADGPPLLELDVALVNEQLHHIRNRPLHYNALAYKDIKKMQVNEDADVCTLHEARAFLMDIPAAAPGADGDGCHSGATQRHASNPPGVPVLAFELKADRFLRRMVRILVSTAVREAHEKAPPDSLLRIVLSGDRSLAAPAAPGVGLCFVGAGYEQYDQSGGGAAIRHRGASDLGQPCSAHSYA